VKVLGFDNVFLEVGDVDAAVAFYRDVLGLPVHKRFEPLRMVLFQVGAETPGLGVAAVAAPQVGGQKVWFEVPDARAAAEELTARGGPVLGAPALIPTGWAFEVRDPWGNVLGLTDYSAHPGLGRQPAVSAGSVRAGRT
jgi:predicted enzyme related to lactoylglutathione lyase